VVSPSSVRRPWHPDAFTDSLVREEPIACEVDLFAAWQAVPVVDAYSHLNEN
jgi:hypothetical protein